MQQLILQEDSVHKMGKCVVVNMSIEKGLPEDWRERIRGKKVIFYNTSVSGILNGGEKHIRKMMQVLEIFRKENRVALWWRPHPLELSTIETMRPELAEKYKEIRTKYEEEGWGILDTSADVHRAIAVSDAYYGDWSSVIQLYWVTGKPILLANDSVTEYDSEIAFAICDFVIIDSDMWFISYSYNCLFKMDLNTLTVHEMIQIPGERIYEQQVMQSVIKAEKKLFLTPCWGSSVIVFDIDTRKIKEIKIGKHTTYPKYPNVYYKNGCLYLVTAEKEKCLKIDMESLDMQLECNQMQGMEAIGECSGNLKSLYPTDKYTVAKEVDEKIYAFSYLENIWEITDTKTGQNIKKRINITDTIKNELSKEQLFDICEDVELSARYSFYGGENKYEYSLPRYMDAIVNRKGGFDYGNKIMDLCGKKIYENM